VLAALGLVGCGGGDGATLARSDAAPLIALSKRIASEGRCAQARDIRALQKRTIALVNARRVPAGLQESLLSGVNQLASQEPVCTPRIAPVATQSVVQAEPVAPVITVRSPGRKKPKHHPAHRGKGHGHGHGKGD